MQSTFSILFYARWEKKKANGRVPLVCRITIDKERAKFGLKSDVNASIWSPEHGRANGHTKEAQQLNQYLDSVKGQLIRHYRRITETGEVATATMVKDAFLGKEVKSTTLLCVFRKFVDRQEQAIGVEITQSTFNKYDLTLRRLEEFLKVKKNLNDILLTRVDQDFVRDFELYLKKEYRLTTNSSEKLMRIFKRVTTRCFKNGQLTKDPFCDIKLKKEKKDRGYLTKDELTRILNYVPKSRRMEKVRDFFIFSCYTGLDYSTLSSLDETCLVKGEDDLLWLFTKRVKTGVVCHVKLLDIPLSIIKKYERRRVGTYLLPIMSNAKYNFYLKELADERSVADFLVKFEFPISTLCKSANLTPDDIAVQDDKGAVYLEECMAMLFLWYLDEGFGPYLLDRAEEMLRYGFTVNDNMLRFLTHTRFDQ